MSYTRRPGWDVRLYELVRLRHNTTFAWGSQDCATFAAEAVLALTGHRPPLPGPWSTAREALRAIAGAGGLQAAVQAVLGPCGTPSLAQRGDIVLIEQPESLGGEALGVHMGTYAIATGPHGLVRVPLEAVRCCWHILAEGVF